MLGMDPARLRDHRRSQASEGFPLLRACPNTSVIGLLLFLDRLPVANQLAYAEQLSDFVEAEALHPTMSIEDRTALLRSLPLIEKRFGPHWGITPPDVRKIDVRVIPVKTLAGVMKDHHVGGLEGWLTLVQSNLSDDPGARGPALAHAGSLAEIAPVAPARLRKLIDAATRERFATTVERVTSDHTRYTAPAPHGFKLDVTFARGSGARKQFDYSIRAGAGPVPIIGYESIWRETQSWDYLTEANAERGIRHFIRLIETCIELPLG